MTNWQVLVTTANGTIALEFGDAESALLVWRGLSTAWHRQSMSFAVSARGARAVLEPGEFRNVQLVNPMVRAA